MRNVRVASVQMESAPGDKGANFRMVERYTAEAAERGASVALFPECCLTGYWFLRRLTVPQLRELAEPVPEGRSSTCLFDLAVKRGVTVGAGLVEAAGGDVFHNTYVVAMPDGRVVRHRKLHAFEHPAIHAGSEHTVFDTPHGFRAGLLICYDNNIVENVRIAALRGAEVLLAPHQTGGCRTTNPHLMGLIERRVWDERDKNPGAIERELRGDKGREWLMRWLPSRAHDNGVFLVFSNGVGVDDDEIRTGNAMILDPYGRVLAETGKAGDDVVVADLDASLLGKATGRLWIQARRPELYRELAVPTGRERDTHQLKLEE
jgi:N-carbamoylputrescine amidase